MRNPILIVLLILLSSLVASGCGAPATSTPQASPPTPTSTSSPQPEKEYTPEASPPTPTSTSSPQPEKEDTPEASPPTPSPTSSPQPVKGDEEMAFQLTSSAFQPEGSIPAKYTCQGEDTSPPLRWSDPPVETASFALIVDDPDAPMGTWVHCVLYNLPGDVRELAESTLSDANLPDGSRQGNNSWGRTGYGGPCPPSGTHRYFFKLYALDAELDLVEGATKEQLLQAMEGHILAQTELMGLYSKG